MPQASTVSPTNPPLPKETPFFARSNLLIAPSAHTRALHVYTLQMHLHTLSEKPNPNSN